MVERPLDGDSGPDSLNGAGELGDDAVASGAEDATIMFGDKVCDDGSIGAQDLNGTVLIDGHEAAVADSISGEDRGEAASSRSRLHGRLPLGLDLSQPYSSSRPPEEAP